MDCNIEKVPIAIGDTIMADTCQSKEMTHIFKGFLKAQRPFVTLNNRSQFTCNFPLTKSAKCNNIGESGQPCEHKDKKIKIQNRRTSSSTLHSLNCARIFNTDKSSKCKEHLFSKNNQQLVYCKMTAATANLTNDSQTLSRREYSEKTTSTNTCSSILTSTTTVPLQENYQLLYDLCCDHSNFFKDDQTEKGQRLCAAFTGWKDFIELANRLVLQIDSFAYKYDFDENTPGNGYRSFVTVTNACANYGLNICQNILATRATMFFRKKFYMKEVEACSQLLSSICTCLEYMMIMHEWSSDSGNLFASEHTAEELFEVGASINQYCFYGRCLGFQYSDTIRSVLRFVSISMASFSESYYAEKADGALVKTTRSVWTGGKYFLNPELRARRIVNLSQSAKIDFCKSFWFLAESEMMHKLPAIVGSSIKVNRVIEIPAETLQLPRVKKHSTIAAATDVNQNDNTEVVDIPVPSSHLGPGMPVKARLLSYSRREGMMGEGGAYRSWRKTPPRSKSIIFHCHGGGFVAQSSKSHELYLRDWAATLDVPMLSVDYSLAPEAPFPRALEEAFYAYCWMLKHAEHLGTTAERVVLAGDSAGGNLAIGVALKCIEMGVRVPDGIFLAYCPTLINFVPSPARLLCVMDPLLPFGFMMRCMRAYAAPGVDTIIENAKLAKEKKDIRNASPIGNFTLHLDKVESIPSSRRTSMAKSPISSVAENSKWDQMQLNNATDETGDQDNNTEESSDTFASASYHSQTVERTDPPVTEDDNSSCVSFEVDSQPIDHYPIDINAQWQKNSSSEQYIDNFLGKYIVETNSSDLKENQVPNGMVNMNGLIPTAAKTASEENLLLDTGKEMIALDSIHGRLHNAVNSISSTLSRYTRSSEIRNGGTPQHRQIENLRKIDALIARSPSVEFSFQVPKNPFLSPYWASDEWLLQLPQINMLTLDMDPCLDDCVMFAKKLKGLGRPVKFEILKGLPHGFLNFTMISSEAMDGSKRCIDHLQDLLSTPTDT